MDMEVEKCRTTGKRLPASCWPACCWFSSFAGVAAAEEENTVLAGTGELNAELIGRYDSGAEFDEGGTEIVVYDPETERAFSVNGFEKSLDILDLSVLKEGSGLREIPLEKRIGLESLGENLPAIDDITSVALHPEADYIAVAVVADPKTDNGYVVLLDKDGQYLNHVEVGALPDMVTFSPNGDKLLVANEGEPNDEYTVNPEGSVSIVEVGDGPESVEPSDVTTVRFDDELVTDEHIRHVHRDASWAEDFEPEYIVVDEDNRYAYVVLQEHNAVAVLDINAGQFERVDFLGYKDHSVSGNGLDASNETDHGRYPALAGAWAVPAGRSFPVPPGRENVFADGQRRGFRRL